MWVGDSVSCSLVAKEHGKVLCWYHENAKIHEISKLLKDLNPDQIGVGSDHICVQMDKEVRCMGKNSSNQLAVRFRTYSFVIPRFGGS